MCVIAVCETKKPSNEMLEKMFNTNKDGASIAWREGKKGDKWVRWEKGITDLKDIKGLVAEKPLPIVVHFRIQTVGGAWLELCHPFTMDEAADSSLSGKTKSTVLFHNGTWGDWKGPMLRCAENFKVRLPEGKFSDTRAMAWLSHFYGDTYLNLIEARGVSFGPEQVKIFFGTGGWTKRDDIYVSNTVWETKNTPPAVTYPSSHGHTPVSTKRMCAWGPCRITEGLDVDGRCGLHPKSEFPFLSQTNGTKGYGSSTTAGTQPTKSTDETGGSRFVESPFYLLSAAAEVERQRRLGWVNTKFKRKALKIIHALVRNRTMREMADDSSTSHTKTP